MAGLTLGIWALSFHAMCTGLELMGILLLWWRQGLLQAAFPPLKWRRLCARVSLRTRPSSLIQVPRNQWRTCAWIAIVGSLALVLFGGGSGLVWPSLPSSWSDSLYKLVATFFMPGVLEEIIFRALLLRLGPPKREPSRSCLKWGPMLPECTAAQGDCTTASSCSSSAPTTVGVSSVAGSPESFRPTLEDVEAAGYWPYTPLPSGPPTEGEEGEEEQEQRDEQASSTMESEGGNRLLSHFGDAAARCTAIEEPQLFRPPLCEQCLALATFVMYHLDLIHALSPDKDMRLIFDDGRFLAMATIVGICCQEVMLRTGSVWPGACMHWLWVWVWLVFAFKQEH